MKRIDWEIPLLTVLFVLICSVSCHGQGLMDGSNGTICGVDSKAMAQSEKIAMLHQLIQTYARYGKFNGSVLVSIGDEILYQNGFGFANLEWEVPNDPHTKYRLASITKQFTAVLILQLVEEGKLELNVPISTYLPSYPMEKGDQITIHHLLTHSSGTPDYAGFSNYQAFERQRHRPDQIIELFAELPLEFDPGERYAYSNSGYVILGVLLEKMTGKPYYQVIQEKILEPLGMQDTGYDDQRTVLKNRASGYNKRWGSTKNSSPIDISLAYSAGALYSTVADLFLWDQALYTDKLLSQQSRDLLFHKHIAAHDRHYGYGWFVGEIFKDQDARSVSSISHSGGINGFRTLIVRLPERKVCIVFLDNFESPHLSEMANSAARILYALPYDMPEKSVAEVLRQTIEVEGIEQGLKLFNQVKWAPGYHLDERELIILGYDLLHTQKAHEAVHVFELGIEVFPESFNVYDSYAEALALLGREKEAILNYKKSIKINPGNQNGLEMLRSLNVNVDSLIHRVPAGLLELLTGEYLALHARVERGKACTIEIVAVNGILICQESARQYELMPISDNLFVNQDFGISMSFDYRNKDAIQLTYSGGRAFRKLRLE